MNFKNQDLKRILNWFDLAEANLSDEDLELYDEIKEYINEESKDNEVSFEDEFLEDFSDFDDDDEDEYEN